MKIHLIYKYDCLKGDWWVWYAYKEVGNDIVYGYVQASGQGETIAEDGFEPEE